METPCSRYGGRGWRECGLRGAGWRDDETGAARSAREQRGSSAVNDETGAAGSGTKWEVTGSRAQ